MSGRSPDRAVLRWVMPADEPGFLHQRDDEIVLGDGCMLPTAPISLTRIGTACITVSIELMRQRLLFLAITFG